MDITRLVRESYHLRLEDLDTIVSQGADLYYAMHTAIFVQSRNMCRFLQPPKSAVARVSIFDPSRVVLCQGGSSLKT